MLGAAVLLRVVRYVLYRTFATLASPSKLANVTLLAGDQMACAAATPF